MHEFETVDVEPLQLVANRIQSRRDKLSVNIPRSLDPVWAFIRSRQLKFGLNVAVYLDGPNRMEVGVQVPGEFEPPHDLVRTQSPGGLAAHGVHMGPYSDLGRTYDLMHEWIAANKFRMKGPFGEVYGHWNDDPQKLRTDIYFLVEKI